MTAGPEALLERVRAATSDEYQIEREIGRGGMAAVFLGRDLALERRVAIKVMLPDLVNVHGVQDRFVIEARTAAHLDHPGIVTVYAVKQRAGLLFIVMKYIEGHTLEAVLRSQGQLDPAAVALIGSRVAEALHFAHGEGVVHRDVKPSNIMIDPRGRPVVTDFGIARVMTAQSITIAGSMLGTPTHMSPEQCRGLPATAASDQYSLGVTMYEMLTGRSPFTGSLFELITAHREQSPPPVSEFVAGVDPALEHTVMRMLAKDPQQRWESLTDVVARLSAHTTLQRGDENLRATLVLSGTGSSAGTPVRGIAIADVRPPGNASTPSSPPVQSPLSPVPASATALGAGAPVMSPMGVPVAEPVIAPGGLAGSSSAGVAGASSPAGRRTLLFGGIAAVVLAAVAFAVMSSGRGSSTAAAPSAKADSSPPAVQTPPPPALPAPVAAVTDSARRDSLARDSTAKALAAKNSTTVDSVPATKAPPEPNRATTSPPRPKANAGRAVRVRPESIAVECARLLERASLGERLTDAERSLLRRRCPK